MRARIIPESGFERVGPVAWRRLGSSAADEEAEGGDERAGADLEVSPEPDPYSVIAELEQRIQAIEAEARAAIAEREKQAGEKGYQAGLRDGESAGRKAAAVQFSTEAASMLAQVTQGVAQLVAFRARVRQQMEADLVRLSIAIARRIVYRELHVDPEALLGIVKAAVDKVESRQLLRLRVPAGDYALLEQPLRDMLSQARADVVSDPSLPRGGLILETLRGELDASVETQLGEIDRGLTDVAGRAR
ncbi:MAG: FliH/SctL family protein [Bryobacteraceae bacterium]